MHVPPISVSIAERIEMAVRCPDSHDIPKVEGAGTVHESPDGRRIQIMHNGLKVLADGYYGSWMTELITRCRGHHEPQEERAFHEVVRRLPADATMIELGGYWAYYSNWFLINQPKRAALVVEPEPTHLAVGKANASLNGLSPTFRHGLAGSRFLPATRFQNDHGEQLSLPQYSVAQLLAEMGWQQLDILHCDIQGGEVDILKSCVPLFKAGMINWIFISTHAHHISGDPLTHERCLDIVKECGGVIEAEHDVYESFSGDGLIVARFKPAPDDWKPIPITYNRHSQSLFRSLSYDLAESIGHNQKASVEAVAPTASETLHPSLRNRGQLLDITQACALGSTGETFILPADEVISPIVCSEAAWEHSLIEEVASRLNNEQSYTLLDIGANTGLFSRQLTTRCPLFHRIICVEPHPDTFAMLGFNLRHLGERVEFFNIALGSEDAQSTLFCDEGNSGNLSLAPDAMRHRPFRRVPILVRETAEWLRVHVKEPGALVWKSDTQGFDETIVAAIPMDIWRRVDIAVMEIWRIEKPAFDREALRARLDMFPYRKLGETAGLSTREILEFAAGDDWVHRDLVLWK